MKQILDIEDLPPGTWAKTPAGRGAQAPVVAADLPDDEIDDCPVLRVLVPAAGLPIPATRAPRSVFEFVPADKPKRQDKNAEPVSPSYAGRVSVASSESGLKVVGMAYPSARWTQERADKEQARRARQRPPKPTFKSKSKKLRIADGEDNE